jgi:hypothetical protein
MNNFAPVNDQSPTPITATPIVAVTSKSSKQKSLIFVLIIILTFLTVVSILLQILVTIGLIKVKSEVMQAYVVAPNGERLAIHQITDEKEKLQHIQNFAAWFADSLYAYRWYIDGPKGEKVPDPGLPVAGGRRIPSAIFLATLAMRPQLAVEYQNNIAQVILEKNLSLKESSYFKTSVGGISPPRSIGKDLWEVYVTGTQISIAESGEQNLSEEYILLKIGRINPVSLSIAQRDYKDMAIANAYVQSSAAGLEVQSVTVLSSKKIQPTYKQSSTTTKGAN